MIDQNNVNFNQWFWNRERVQEKEFNQLINQCIYTCNAMIMINDDDGGGGGTITTTNTQQMWMWTKCLQWSSSIDDDEEITDQHF